MDSHTDSDPLLYMIFLLQFLRDGQKLHEIGKFQQNHHQKVAQRYPVGPAKIEVHN
jgi:hypothetical protein